MNTINALGFVEVYGLVAGIEAADAMLKSARVRLLRQHEVRPGLITLTVEGDLAACRAAVDAGVAAASRIGTVISSHVIGRPDEDTETMVLDLIPRPPSGTIPQAGPSPRPRKTAAPAEAAPQAAKGKTPPAGKAKAPVVPVQPPGDADEMLEFIARATRGRSWLEIAKRFPGAGRLLREELEAHVAAGILIKVGARYRKT